MNRTPFYFLHKSAGGKIVDFAGWEMPVQFSGIMSEHRAVREAAGIFDISHMGQVWVTGPDAAAYLQNLVTNDVSKTAPGKGLYALMCREDGGVIDDLYIYCVEPGRYLVIVNASRAPVDIQWMRDHSKGNVEILEQPQPAAVALQGPRAEEIMKIFSPQAVSLLKNGVGEFSLLDMDVVAARTGYTGEDGFEIFAPAGHLVPLYSALLKKGEEFGLTLCGLGARDTLRLEMGYRLYGNDLDEQHTALEAGLGWVVKFDKGDFVGREALLKEKTKGSARRLISFRLKERGIPRHGHFVYFDGKQAGVVTSGTFSPSLQIGIGMGYVENSIFPGESAEGLTVRIHDRNIPAEIAALPFYKKETAAVKSS